VQIPVPEVSESAVLLAPQIRRTRGMQRRPARLGNVMTMGTPVVQRVDADLAADDPALRAFLSANDGQWGFHLVHLACTFVPDEAAWFVSARLAVQLGDGAIVWSLTPLRQADSGGGTRTLKLGAKAVFAEAGLESSSPRPAEVFLEGFGLQEQSCAWEFKRTSVHAIQGSHRLAMVVRSAAGVESTASVTVTAAVGTKRWAVLTYRSDLAEQPPLMFTLPAAG
jgi:hypothetical protein